MFVECCLNNLSHIELNIGLMTGHIENSLNNILVT